MQEISTNIKEINKYIEALEEELNHLKIQRTTQRDQIKRLRYARESFIEKRRTLEVSNKTQKKKLRARR